LIERAGRVVALLPAGGDPSLPFVVRHKRQGDEEERDEAEGEFHGWK
jgi:hypothetical protein